MAMSLEANYSTGGGGRTSYTHPGHSTAPSPYVNRQRADSTTSSSYYNQNTQRFSQSSAELLTREFGDQDYQHQQHYAHSSRAMTPGSTGAGYNPSSFIQPGREAPVKGLNDDGDRSNLADTRDFDPHEEGWDVYADFNNGGPRYSTAFPVPTAANNK